MRAPAYPYVRRHSPDHVAAFTPPPDVSREIHQAAALGVGGFARSQCLADVLKQTLVGRQGFQLGFRKTATNKKTVSFGKVCIGECIKRDQFSTGLLKCFEIVRIIEAKGGITCNGYAYIGFGIAGPLR